MAERTLTVKIVGDERDLRRAFASSEKSAQAFQGRVSRVGASVSQSFLKAGIAAGATAVSYQAVTAAIGQSVSNASNLAEQISKSRQVFGESSGAIEAWAQTTARSMGIARDQALEATGTFGNLLTTVGLAPNVAGDMSRSLVQLAADLGSLNNVSTDDVLSALRSGLIGEAEPLRRYGVLLSEAKIQQEAMAATGKTNVKALTEQEKALARYHIILREAATSQGNFVLTSDDLAQQTKILRAQMRDLSTDLGGVLVPVLTDAAIAANQLFAALEQMRGVDFSPGFDFPEADFFKNLATSPIPGLGLAAELAKRFGDEEKELERIVGPDRGLGDERGTPEGRIAERARQRAESARLAKASVERSQKDFATFTKGLGLKLDRAGLTDSFNDDIAVLRELERAILRQITREGRTFKLVEQLTQTRLQLSSTVGQRAQDAADATRDAWDATMDSLSLKLEVAQTTKSFVDNQAALRVIEQTIKQRIEQEGKTTDFLRQLFQVRQQQADIQRQMAEKAKQQRQAAREARQGDQFEALGLTEEGQRRTPGVGALRRRLGNLREQLKGTALDTDKTRSELARIGKVLRGEFGAVGRDVRASILQMQNDIADALDGKQGPLTKTSGLNSKKMTEGLGLSPEQINALRGRLSSFNTAGQAPANFASAAGIPGGFGGAQGPIVVESHTTITLDGDVVARAVTRNQQKQRSRNPQQKRGPNRIGGV